MRLRTPGLVARLRGRWVRLAGVTVVLVLAVGAIALLSRDGGTVTAPDESRAEQLAIVPPGTATAFAIPGAPAHTATPVAPPASGTSAPAPGGAPPGINLAALASDDERAVGEAVNEANAAVVQTLRTGDRAVLASRFTGEALEQYGQSTTALRAGGRYAVTELLALELLDVRVLDPARAEVRTRERWLYTEYTLADERLPNTAQETLDSEIYTLVKQAGRWRVERLEITNLSTTPR
jgi:hypothetical protein